MKKVLSSLRTAALGWLLFLLMAYLVNLPLHHLVWFYPKNGPLGTVAAALAVLALYRWLSRFGFRGMLLDGGGSEGMRVSVVFFAYLLLTRLGEQLIFRIPYTAPTLESVSLAFCAGFGEELCFRGLLLSGLMKNNCRRELIVPAAAISASSFAVSHASNLFIGANPGATLVQVVSSCLIGFFWAALFLRCGSLLPCILTHVMLDVVAMMAVSRSTGVLTAGVDPCMVVDLLLRLGLCGFGVWLLREEKRQEIIALWRKKWGEN